MEIDFQAIKALSSPTRVTLLRELVNNPSTTTDLSEALEMSKSTVSDHLAHLHEANLVEKEDKDGRRRVVYRPTRRAKHIIKGSRRKVQFSLSAATVFLVGGILSITQWIRPDQSSDTAMNGGSGGPGIMTEGTETASEPGLLEQTITYLDGQAMLALGVVLVLASLILGWYGIMQRRLSKEQDEV